MRVERVKMEFGCYLGIEKQSLKRIAVTVSEGDR